MPTATPTPMPTATPTPEPTATPTPMPTATPTPTPIPHVHDYGSWTDYTDKKAYKYCSGCDDVITHSHVLVFNDSENTYYCSVDDCLYEKTIECVHNYLKGKSYLTMDPSRGCVEVEVECTKCGDSYVETVRSHDWDHFEYDGIDYMTCTTPGCGVETERAIPVANNETQESVLLTNNVYDIENKRKKLSLF